MCNRLTVGPLSSAQFKKVGRLVRQPTQLIRPELSADVGKAHLGIRLSRGRWLRRQLKHRCFLTR